MSFRPVFGRRSAVASLWMRLANSGSTSMVTMPWPSLSSTFAMSPTRTPEMRTVCPWPGVTAWAVANEALSWNGVASHGKRNRWLARMYAATPPATTAMPTIIKKSFALFLITRIMAWRPCCH